MPKYLRNKRTLNQRAIKMLHPYQQKLMSFEAKKGLKIKTLLFIGTINDACINQCVVVLIVTTWRPGPEIRSPAVKSQWLEYRVYEIF